MLLECDCRHDPRQRFSSGGFCTRDVSLTPSHVLIIALPGGTSLSSSSSSSIVALFAQDTGSDALPGGTSLLFISAAGRLRRVPASVRVGCQLLLITVGPPVVCR